MQAESSLKARLSQSILTLFAMLIILLMLIIVLQVALNLVGLNPLHTFTHSLPLFGRAITLNSLMELQWHLLVIIGLLPCALVWRMNGHVRVDFLYAKWSDARQAKVDLLGNLILTIPFLILCLPASWNFMMRAWQSAEVSTNGGLSDRFAIKAVLPLGFAILGIVLLLELPALLRRAFKGHQK